MEERQEGRKEEICRLLTPRRMCHVEHTVSFLGMRDRRLVIRHAWHHHGIASHGTDVKTLILRGNGACQFWKSGETCT